MRTTVFARVVLILPSAARIPLWHAGLPIQSSAARVPYFSFGAALSHQT
jgi:hypothetical protein